MKLANATRSALWTGRRPAKAASDTKGSLAGSLAESPAPDFAPPTAREAQLVILIAQGLSNKIIAHQLNISPNTVRSHISNIMRKYKLRNRTQVAMLLMPQIKIPGSMSLMR